MIPSKVCCQKSSSNNLTFSLTSAQTQNAGAASNNNATSIDSGVCEDIIDGCINFSSQCDKINIRNGCRKTCNLCDTDTDIGNLVENQLCQDLLPACDLQSDRPKPNQPPNSSFKILSFHSVCTHKTNKLQLSSNESILRFDLWNLQRYSGSHSE